MLKNIGVFGAVAAVSLAACSTRVIEREVIHTPAPQPATVQVAPAPAPVVVAAVQPPPAQVETVPPAPAADMIWMPGYWNFVNGQYVWVAGRYEPVKDRLRLDAESMGACQRPLADDRRCLGTSVS